MIRQALGQDDGLGGLRRVLRHPLRHWPTRESTATTSRRWCWTAWSTTASIWATYGARWARSTDDAFSRFVQWCDGETSCALHGQDVAAVFDGVAAAHPEIRAGCALASRRAAYRSGLAGYCRPLATAAGSQSSASPQPEARRYPQTRR